jgi:two-component system, chemotaxis family, response regulator WspF
MGWLKARHSLAGMRIAIVNDVMLAVEAMRRVILTGSSHEIAWVAQDGAEAIERCLRDRPDLILMDLIMPRVDGVEATRLIMTQVPCAVLVVTANVTENLSKVFEAMGAGALDAVNTPVLQLPGTCKGADALLAKIETLGKLVGVPQPERDAAGTIRRGNLPARHPESLVAIGASAGGPAALAQILSELPSNFSAPIVVVQHVDSQFAPGLASWLDCQSPLEVRLAHEGDQPVPGVALLAGGDHHLVFSGPARLAYTRQPLECSYRPSIDVFFKSIERWWEGDIVAVILTGMGRDGAEGLRSLRRRGHRTLVQDQASSAVYGMPKAAAAMNAADEILPLDQIASRIVRLVSRARRDPPKFSIHSRERV